MIILSLSQRKRNGGEILENKKIKGNGGEEITFCLLLFLVCMPTTPSLLFVYPRSTLVVRTIRTTKHSTVVVTTMQWTYRVLQLPQATKDHYRNTQIMCPCAMAPLFSSLGRMLSPLSPGAGFGTVDKSDARLPCLMPLGASGCYSLVHTVFAIFTSINHIR